MTSSFWKEGACPVPTNLLVVPTLNLFYWWQLCLSKDDLGAYLSFSFSHTSGIWPLCPLSWPPFLFAAIIISSLDDWHCLLTNLLASLLPSTSHHPPSCLRSSFKSGLLLKALQWFLVPLTEFRSLLHLLQWHDDGVSSCQLCSSRTGLLEVPRTIGRVPHWELCLKLLFVRAALPCSRQEHNWLESFKCLLNPYLKEASSNHPDKCTTAPAQ